jgi:hypothetical protein
MTVIELRSVLQRLDYEVPLSVFPSWTNEQKKKIRNYCLWKLTDNSHKPGPRTREPFCLRPFKLVEHPLPERIKKRFHVVWSLKDDGFEPIGHIGEVEHGVTLRVLPEEERALDFTI